MDFRYAFAYDMPPFKATKVSSFPMIAAVCDRLRHETMMMITISTTTIIPSTPAIAPMIIGRGMESSAGGGVVAGGFKIPMPTEALTPLLIRSLVLLVGLLVLLVGLLVLLVGLLVLLGCTVVGFDPPGRGSVEKGLS